MTEGIGRRCSSFVDQDLSISAHLETNPLSDAQKAGTSLPTPSAAHDRGQVGSRASPTLMPASCAKNLKPSCLGPRHLPRCDLLCRRVIRDAIVR